MVRGYLSAPLFIVDEFVRETIQDFIVGFLSVADSAIVAPVVPPRCHPDARLSASTIKTGHCPPNRRGNGPCGMEFDGDLMIDAHGVEIPIREIDGQLLDP